MEKWLYVMIIKKGKSYNKVTKSDAGMVIFKTNSYEEAEALCKLEPLVAEGYATYTLVCVQVADKDNDYLL